MSIARRGRSLNPGQHARDAGETGQPYVAQQTIRSRSFAGLKVRELTRPLEHRPAASYWAVGRWLDRWVGECRARSPQSSSLRGGRLVGSALSISKTVAGLSGFSRCRRPCPTGVGASPAWAGARSLSTVGGRERGDIECIRVAPTAR